MIFKNRQDAGKQLANKLANYKNKKNGLVVGLPRGGIPVAYEIASFLKLPLDIVCPRKIGAALNKEFAIGAITETGTGLLDEALIQRLHIPKSYIDNEIKKETIVANTRLATYRKGKPPRNFLGKIIILVDDGLATGATMKAAIYSIRAEGAEEIIVAVPVAPQDTLNEIRIIAEGVICLHAPLFFQAVGQFYEDFNQTEDEEVIRLIQNLS